MDAGSKSALSAIFLDGIIDILLVIYLVYSYIMLNIEYLYIVGGYKFVRSCLQ